MNTRAVRHQARIELLLTLRRGESLLVTFGIPLGILVFFAKADTMKSDLLDRGYKHPIDFLVPGVLALAVISTAMVSLGIATGYERRYAVLKRLGSTPLSRGGLLAAKTLNVLAIELVQAIVIIAAGVALGWSATARILPAVVVVLLGTVAFAGIGMLLAGTLRAEANLAVANGLFLVMLAFGGVFYDLERLPQGLELLARALPAAALSESLRAILTAGKSFPTGPLLVLLVWAVAAPLLAARYFRWEE